MQMADRTADQLRARSDYSEVAVLIPCHNEAGSIASTVREFRAVLPAAKIYVYDNNSSDGTSHIAASSGAIVRHEPLQGKGYVVRRMFADVDADVYLLIDGDGTYDIGSAPRLIEMLTTSNVDLVNGRRVAANARSYRTGHQLGNRLLTSIVGRIFGRRMRDMLSGYKAFSRRFVKSFPCLSTGFEIETEIAIHALGLGMPIGEIDVPYRDRAAGSDSKLRTIHDGFQILFTIARLLASEKPFRFFGVLCAVLALPAIALGIAVYVRFEATHVVAHIPSMILATGMMLMAGLSFACGVILETVTLGRREQKRMVYLGVAHRDAMKTNSL